VGKITALGLGRDEKGTTTKKKDYKHVYIKYKGVMREGTALFNKGKCACTTACTVPTRKI
jgi:hypothetical protein